MELGLLWSLPARWSPVAPDLRPSTDVSMACLGSVIIYLCIIFFSASWRSGHGARSQGYLLGCISEGQLVLLLWRTWNFRSWTRIWKVGGSVQFSCSVMSDSLWPHGLQHARLPKLGGKPTIILFQGPYHLQLQHSFHIPKNLLFFFWFTGYLPYLQLWLPRP